MKSRFHPLFIVLLLLATIGLLYTMITSFVSFMFTVAVLAAIYYALRNYARTGRFLPTFRFPASGPTKNTWRTTKQSGKKSSASARARSTFQVIDGNKGKTKEKDDASNDRSNMFH